MASVQTVPNPPQGGAILPPNFNPAEAFAVSSTNLMYLYYLPYTTLCDVHADLPGR